MPLARSFPLEVNFFLSAADTIAHGCWSRAIRTMNRKSRTRRKPAARNAEWTQRSLPLGVGTLPRRFERLEYRRLLTSDMDFSLLAGDLQSALTTVQTSVATALNQAPSVPILGASLQNNPALTQTIARKANDLQTAFEAVANDLSANPTAADATIVGYVQARLGSVASNIVVTPEIDADGSWRFTMQLHQNSAVASVHPQFDAGLGSYFNVSGGDGGLDLRVGMDYLLQFTFDPKTSALSLESTNLSSVDPSLPDTPLAIEVAAAPSAGFSLDATLGGSLHLSAADNGTQFTGTYAVNVASPSQASASLTASAHVGLGATVDFGSDNLPFDPKLTSKFHFDWALSGTTLASGIDGNAFGSLANIGFDDVTLDAGSFFGGYVASMIKDIQHFTKPLEPIVDMLTTEIPGLSDIGIHESLLTLLDPSGASDALTALDTIKQLNSLDVSSLNGSGTIDFGSFTIGDDIRSAGASIATSNVAPDVMQQADNAAGDTLSALGQTNSIAGVQFPILSDPVHNVFGLLTGQNATLFTFKMPEFSFPFTEEIPVIAIEPFAGLFLDVKLLFTINLSMGYDTQGIKELVHDVSSGTTDPATLASDLSDGFYLDNGTHTATFDDYPNLTVHNTGVEISGGVALAAKAVVLKVEGGIFADVDLHLDPTLNDPNSSLVRLSKVAEEISNGEIPFTATGSIFVSADLEVVIPAPFADITLAHVNLAHITLLSFDVSHQVPTESDGQTIHVNESASDQSVHVQMEQLAPDIFGVAPPDLGDVITGKGNFQAYYFDNPDQSDPKAYLEAIVVSYADHTETYPVAYYHHVNGALLGMNLEQRYVDANFPGLPTVKVGVFKTVSGDATDDLFTPIHYNLISTQPPPPDPLNEILGIGKQTISIGDIYGDATGAPVNAVLIGGGDDDTLEYDGHGKAVLIGGGGNNSLRAFNNAAQGVYVFGNTIDPSAFDASTINFPMPSEIHDQIQSSVQSPASPPDHTSDVLAGAGSSVFLGGGPWDNFFEGPGTATFVGGAGQNEFRMEAKLTDPSVPFVPGSLIDNPSATNTVILDRNGVPDPTHDSLILRAEAGFLHITGNVTDLTLEHHEALAISMAGGTLDVGDLSPLGPFDFLVTRGSNSAPPTTAIFDTPTAGLVDPLYIEPNGPVDPVGNPNLLDLDLLQGPGGAGAGANVEMVGFTRFDSLYVKLRGGQVNIGDLNGTGMGLIKIDGSMRPADSTAINDISVTTHPENLSLAPDAQKNVLIRLEDSSSPYDVEIDDDRPQDITTLIVPTQDLSNLATVDASQMQGTLHMYVGGATLMLLQAAAKMTVIVAGTDSANPAEITVGDSNLSHIQSNVSVTGAELTLDNAANTAGHIFTMTTNSFTGWTIPSSTFEPTIFLGNDLSPLVGTMTLLTAAGDEFDIEGTPPKVKTLVFDNASLLRNAIFVVAATSNMIINGDFDLYLGRRLEPDGAIEREKHLPPISNVRIVMNFKTVISDYASTIFDGDLDSPDTTYQIDGLNNLHIVNQTIGLDVTINKYRPQDQVYVYLPGGTVNADLDFTSPGDIYLDGQARLAGFNATAGNLVTVQDRYGQTQLNPISQYNSVLQSFNNLYLLGSIPQDSLSVTVPTNVVMTASVANTFDLARSPTSYETLTPLTPPPDTPSLISWESGPQNGAFGAPVLDNVDEDNWASYFAPDNGRGTPPDPFEPQPYGIVVPFSEGKLTESYWTYRTVNGQEALTHDDNVGTVYYWLVNPHPTAIDNNVTLDASQLRGSFKFNVDGPDYDYLKQLEHDSFEDAVDQSVTFDGVFTTWGKIPDIMRMAFGQSNIVLSHVNSQLSVSINSTSQIPDYFSNNGNIPYTSVSQTAVTPFPFTTVTVGTGTLANIQGDVAVHNVFLKDVDDRQGVLAGNLILTASTLAGWATPNGTHATLSFDSLQGDLTISGSTLDQFGVEDTPNSADQTTIENFGTTGPTANVYVMGKTVMPLYINGHFSVDVGRRLNSDGSVTDVGQVDGVFNAADKFALSGGYVQGPGGLFYYLHNGALVTSSQVNMVPGVPVSSFLTSTTGQQPLPVFFNYAGDGQGTLVFDASSDIYVPTMQGGYSGAYEGITANPNYPGDADLRYRTVGDIIWGANVDAYDYAPAYNRPLMAAFSQGGPTEIINNPVNGPLHYFVNPNTIHSSQEVYVGATAGPLEVVGDDTVTRVDLDPAYSQSIATMYNIVSPGLLPGWGAAGGGGGNLLGTIVGDVTVRHAGLTVHADTAGSPAPASPPLIVLTDTQVTGIAGGAIQFSDLTQSYSLATQNAGTFTNQFPGLVLRMPSYGGVSVQVQNTPGGATTELYTETNAINDLTVLGTTGPLGLDNVSFASGAEYSAFAAGSLSIGEGDLRAIAGSIGVGSASVLGKVTIDDRSDATSRQTTFAPVPSTSFFGLAGLSPAVIEVDQFASFPEFDIYGAAASTYSFQGGLQNTQLFAGAGSSAELTQSTSSNVIAPVSVFGAATVLIDLKVNPSFQAANTINVAPDPARPTDTTDLTIDFTKIPVSGLKLGSVGGGIYALFGNGDSTQAVLYHGATTHLALLLYSQATTNSLPVTDTASGGTTISPGAYALNVQQTSGPLTIDQSGTGAVTLGNSGSLAGIQGAVSVLANSLTLPPLSLTLDDSADSASKVVTLSQDDSGNTQISGAVVTPIQITGSQFRLALKEGPGTNTLVAPEIVDDWQVTSANGGVLNRTITFSGFGSLQSGSQNDSIVFKPGGSLTGNLDGGPGTDTLYYQAGMLTGSDVINLPAHIAPRVTGQALNIESSGTFSALTIANPGTLSVQVDAPLTPVTIAVSGGSGTKTFSATGLPSGVAIDPATGVIAGTNTTEFYSATVVVTVTDDTGSASTNFGWTTLPGLILTTPANQSSQVSQVLTLPIRTSYSYGGTLTYTATDLPAGLSIDSQTGVISGAIADGAQNNSPYSVSVNATDGTHSATVFFNWTVAKSFVVVNPGTQIFPENLPIDLQMQALNGSAPYTYSASGLPLSLQIDPNTGLISGTLADYADSSGHYLNFIVTVSATDSTNHTVSTTFTFGTEPGFFMTGVGDQSNRAGDVVDDFVGAFNADQNATLITSLTGLPPGLTYDPSTHLVTGTIADSAFTASPYLTTVTVVNQTFNYTYTTTFHWTVTPAIVMANPGDQTSVLGTVVNLPIVVTQSFGQPVTFSASSELPLGLTLDPNTGVISGTVGPQLDSSADFNIDIHATDGTVDGDLLFRWHVGQAAANVVQLFDPTSGGTLALTSPVGTTLTADIDTDSSYYDSANDVQNFPLGYLRMSVQGVVPGGAANVELHSSTLVNPADYYVFGPTPANSDYHWYDFLYQRSTDSDDASTTGAEFLPDGDILLHFVDDGRGDADRTADGTITVNADGPAALALSAHIVGAPPTWPAGVPLTLASEIGGSAAPGASLHWQGYYTPDFNNYFNLPDGADSTYTFTPPESGYYYVTLTATSADGSVTDTDDSYYLNVPSTTVGTEPIGAFTIGGIPSDIVAGHAITATILADDASGSPLDGYTGPISVQITDPHNTTIYSTSGNFDPSQFIFGPITLNTAGSSPTAETITVTAGSTTVSLPIVVHPVSRFVPLQNPPTVAEQTPFSLSFAAEDDRGVFDATYSGSAKLVYTDQVGQHDLSGGFQTVSDGVAAFENIVLPGGGVYLVQAISADGNIVGTTFVVSQGTAVIQQTHVQVISDHPTGSTYGQSVQFTATVRAATGTPTGSIQFEIDGADVGTPVTLVGSSASFSTSQLTASNHTILVVYTSDDPTFDNTDGGLQENVAPAPLTVTVTSTSKVYGADLPTLAYTTSAFVSGDTASTALTGALATTATKSSSVNSYPITQGTLAAVNYTITFVPGTLQVTQAPLTVTANSASKIYGAAVPTLTYTTSAFVNGDSATSALTGAMATTAAASSPVANYPITQGTLAAANYLINFAPGTLQVTPATLTVTADNKTKVYGMANPALTATIGGFVNGDTSSAVNGAASLSTATTSASGVGNDVITASAGTLSAANYTFVFVNGMLSVTPATVTVTADNKSIIAGSTVPVLTAMTAGFVNGDTASAVSGAATLSTTATSTSPVGTYPIVVTQGTLSAANYTFAFVNGTLTITGSAALVVLDPTSRGSIAITGNANVQVMGNAEVLSKNQQAIVATGNAAMSATQTAIEGSPGTSFTGNAKISGKVVSGLTPAQDPSLSDPFAALPVPTQPTSSFAAANYSGNMTATLKPGTYLGGIPVSGKADVTLLPGLYYLKGGGLSVSGGSLMGNGVVIYIAQQSGKDAISVTGQATISLTAPTSGAYQGVAIFQDRSSNAPLAVSGRGSLDITGSIYAAAATLNISGNGKAQVFSRGSVVVDDLIVSGNGLTINASQDPPVSSAGDPANIMATAGVVSGNEYSTLSGVTLATFSDRDLGASGLAAGDFTAAIDWGDGTTSAGDVAVVAGGTPPPQFAVTGTHTYQDEGYYTASVTVSQTNDPSVAATVTTPATIHEEPFEEGTTGTPNQNYIQEIYRDLLGRVAEPQGHDYWVAELAQGMARGDVAYQIVRLAFSEEFQRDTVDALYEQDLGRAPDPQGEANWINYLFDGGTIEGMSQALVSSPEYWQTRGGGTAEGFLKALFQHALGRAIDPAALTYFEGQMAQGVSAADIAASVFNSDEYHRVRANVLFEQFMDRPGDQGGLAFFAGELDHGSTDELVISQLLASDEYFAKAQV